MKICYMHHALRAMGNPPSQDDDIMPLGENEAKVISQILEPLSKRLKIKAIYTSPYFRCKKTSKIINEVLNVPIYEEPRFNEFENVFALVQGKDFCKEKETWLDCQLRIREAIKDIVNKYSCDETVICVTSGVNISAFISLAYKIKPDNNLPLPLVPGCSPICFDIDESSF